MALALPFACTKEVNNPDEHEGTSKDNTVHVAGISLSQSSVTLKEGEYILLIATVTPVNATNKTVTWASSNEAIATVDDNGKVTGVKAGSATIMATAEDGGVKATCLLSVKANLSTSVTVGANHISSISAVLAGKANLDSTVATDLQVGFQYSKSSGILPSNSTTVEATDADGQYNYSVAITGLEPYTKYYFRSFVRQNGQDTYGETKEFNTKDIVSLLETQEAEGIEAANATLNSKLDLTDVIFESISYGFYWGNSETFLNTDFKCTEIKDKAIFAELTGLSHRTQYWFKSYVKLDSQIFYGSVKTFTTGVVPVTNVSLDKFEYTFHTIGDTLTLNAIVSPADATDKSIEWTSDNTSIASVDPNGKVTAIGNGTATIAVTSLDCGETASCVVNVVQRVMGIRLNKSKLTLYEGEEEMLIPTINPMNAADKTIKWTSSNASVALVDDIGKVTAVSKGSATIKAEANDGSGVFTICTVVVKEPFGPVDLGLPSGLKWANANLGADEPKDFGDYYAWGELEPYCSRPDTFQPLTWKEGKTKGYTWASYQWCNGDSHKLTKYCHADKASYWDGVGSPDGKTVLALEDDAAHVKLGGKWRIPTEAEWDELLTNCTWTWKRDGVNGAIVTGPNGNSIFFPAAGYYAFVSHTDDNHGYYWASSLGSNPEHAWCVDFNSNSIDKYAFSRICGQSIRPVSE